MWGYVGVCVYPQTMYSKKNKDWGELKLKQRQEGAAAPSFPGPGCTPNVSAVGEGKRGTHRRPRDSWLRGSRGVKAKCGSSLMDFSLHAPPQK